MATRRVLRKITPATTLSFDDQLWPIYLALTVLSAYGIGVIITYFRFDDPRFSANAATWLTGTALVIFGLSAWVRWVESRWLRRTMLLSLLLSMIAHLSFLVVMAVIGVLQPFSIPKVNSKSVVETRREVVVPEYPIHRHELAENVPQEFERPVETGEATAQERLEVTRQTDAATDELAKESLPSPVESQALHVATRPERAVMETVPRAQEALGKLSRQPLQAEPKTSKTPESPRLTERPTNETERDRESPELEPNRSSLVQQAHKSSLERATVDVETTSTNAQPKKLALSRSQQDSTPAIEVASVPRLTREIPRPSNLPQSSTPIAETMSRPLEVDDHPEPQSTFLRQQVTSSPRPEPRSVELTPTVTSNLPKSRTDQSEQPPQQVMLESFSRTEWTRPAPATEQSVSKAEMTPSEVDPSQQESSVDSTTVGLAKQADREPIHAPSTVALQDDSPPTAPPNPMLSTRLRSEETPSVAAEIGARPSRVKTPQTSDVASTTLVDVPRSSMTETEASQPTSEATPSRMALSQSTQGTAGSGESANLASGAPAPDSQVVVPMAAARREESTQESQPGAALSPTSPARSRRLVADAPIPKSSLRAESVPQAEMMGDPRPSDEVVSASASLTRADSNALPSTTTATRGTGDIDLASTRVAADVGDRHAGGGGQPEILSGDQPRALARRSASSSRAELPSQADEGMSGPAGRDRSPDPQPTASGAIVGRADNSLGSALSSSAAHPQDSEIASKLNIGPSSARKEMDLDASDSMTGQTATGGGTASPGREARQLQIKTATESDLPAIAGEDASAGEADGEPLDAQGTRSARGAAGFLAGHSTAEPGVAGGDPAPGDPEQQLAPALGLRATGTIEGEQGTAPLGTTEVGAPERSVRPSVASARTEVTLDPEEFAQNFSDADQADALQGVPGDGELLARSLSTGGAMTVDLDVPETEGGIGTISAPNLGIVARQSQEDSPTISLQPARFLTKVQGGSTAKFNDSVVVPQDAFRQRVSRKGKAPAAERGLPTPKTEAAIEAGLVFLSRYQSPDGSWSLDRFAVGKVDLPEDDATMVSDTAATGLALLAYLGAGYHHKDDKYQAVVSSALLSLRKHQKENGDLYQDQDANSSRSAWMYSHGIAALALCEAYGMTQDPELKEPAQKALDFIVSSQHPSRGGWRYSPGFGSDTSVTGWMMMALKSGEYAGLTVPKETYRGIQTWIEISRSSESENFLYRYNPYAPDTDEQRHGRKPSRAMTAVGLLMRLYSGARPKDVEMIQGAQVLSQNLPELGTTEVPRRDTYYWYYATQVMFHMGGAHWELWNQRLHPLLTSTQEQKGPLSGSWNPSIPVPDRWSQHGGRLYVTTMNLLSLEVYYRHLPLYDAKN